MPNVKLFLVEQGLATWKDDNKDITFNSDVKIGTVQNAIKNMDKIKGVPFDYDNSAMTYLL